MKMPAKCPFCKNNTHKPPKIGESDVCKRVFLKKNEAWTLIGDDQKPDYHVIVPVPVPGGDILTGADWSRRDVKKLLECSEYIELADPNNHARRWNHGIAVMHNRWHWYIETNEKALKAYEELYDL